MNREAMGKQESTLSTERWRVQLWAENLCDLSGQPHVESCPPHPCCWQLGTAVSLRGRAWEMFTLLAPSSFLVSFSEALGQGSLLVPLLGLHKRREWRKLADPCPHPDSDPGLSTLSSSPTPTSGSLKLLEPFALGSLNREVGHRTGESEWEPHFLWVQRRACVLT